MTVAASPIHMRWTLDPVPGALDTGTLPEDLTGIPLPLPPEIGTGHFNKLHLPHGACFIQGVCEFLPAAHGRLWSIGELAVDYFTPTFIVQTARSGRVCHREFGPDMTVLFGDGKDLFCHAQKRHMLVKIDGSSRNEVIGLHLAVESLEAFLGREEAQRLLERLGIGAPTALAVRRMPRQLSGLLHAALSRPHLGPARKLFAQAKALEYLSALAEHLQLETRPGTADARSRKTLQALRDHLLGLEGKLPTLEALAREFQMPARRLNQDFTQAYGESIFAFITGHRLDQAREVLLREDLPMKVLADRLGYGHVNNFINAFKRRFGQPPGRLRRGLPD